MVGEDILFRILRSISVRPPPLPFLDPLGRPLPLLGGTYNTVAPRSPPTLIFSFSPFGAADDFELWVDTDLGLSKSDVVAKELGSILFELQIWSLSMCFWTLLLLK